MGRELDGRFLKMGIKSNIQRGTFLRIFKGKGDESILRSPVGIKGLMSVPIDILICQESFSFQKGVVLSKLNAESIKAKKAPVFFKGIPLKPVVFIILRPGVIIAETGMAVLVAHQEHGDAKGEHEGKMEIAQLSLPEAKDIPSGSCPLFSAIPTLIVIGSVSILFSVRQIMFLLVGD